MKIRSIDELCELADLMVEAEKANTDKEISEVKTQMINYEFFYDIATYGSENWKGNFTPKEIACNAYCYLCEFQTSKEAETPTQIMKSLYELLVEDGTEAALDWAYEIASELGLIDMDYMDYMETDSALIKKILEK